MTFFTDFLFHAFGVTVSSSILRERPGGFPSLLGERNEEDKEPDAIVSLHPDDSG